jgi:hypothetical protein
MRFLIKVLLLCSAVTAQPAAVADDAISPAEHRVFLDEHLNNIHGAIEVRYTYTQKAGPKDSYTDQVTLKVGAGSREQRAVDVDFLTGERKLALASIEGGTGNPVILYFLEHDIRDLHNRLGGQSAFFRKRIRLALADAAIVKPVKLSFGGKTVDGQEVTIAPYRNDPLKDRLKHFVSKTYVFTLSDAIPGGVYELRTHVDAGASAEAEPAIDTRMKISGDAT